jgi:hypothetical protein
MKLVRSFLCILVNLSLALAFVQAPFLHVHQHESTEKHAGVTDVKYFFLLTTIIFPDSAASKETLPSL